MIFILKHKDEELIKFEVLKNIEEPVLKILGKNDKKKNLFPLDLELSGKGLAKWIKRRNIPKNRAFVYEFLSKQGLSPNRPIDIIKISKGLSLNDVYWVVEEVKKYISKEIKAKLKRLFNFEFAKSKKYSRSEKQIKMIESMISERTRKII